MIAMRIGVFFYADSAIGATRHLLSDHVTPCARESSRLSNQECVTRAPERSTWVEGVVASTSSVSFTGRHPAPDGPPSDMAPSIARSMWTASLPRSASQPHPTRSSSTLFRGNGSPQACARSTVTCLSRVGTVSLSVRMPFSRSDPDSARASLKASGSHHAIGRFDPGFYAGSRSRYSKRDRTILLIIGCSHSHSAAI